MKAKKKQHKDPVFGEEALGKLQAACKEREARKPMQWQGWTEYHKAIWNPDEEDGK